MDKYKITPKKNEEDIRSIIIDLEPPIDPMPDPFNPGGDWVRI